jgi:hypothetical protein
MTAGVCASAANGLEKRLMIRPALPRPRIESNRFAGVGEPALDELMADPVLYRLMASDGVAMHHLVTLITDARTRLARP